MSHDFTTTPTIPHRIVNLDEPGEDAGQAPGIDARHALETFNRDAANDEGLLFFREDLGDIVHGGRAWVLNLGERGEFVAYPTLSDEWSDTPSDDLKIGRFVASTKRVTVELWDTDLTAIAQALATLADLDDEEHTDGDNLRRLSAIFAAEAEKAS